MTGGRVYVRINAFGLDREAIERRLELYERETAPLVDVLPLDPE